MFDFVVLFVDFFVILLFFDVVYVNYKINEEEFVSEFWTGVDASKNFSYHN